MNCIRIKEEKFFPKGHVAIQVFLSIDQENKNLDDDMLNVNSQDLDNDIDIVNELLLNSNVCHNEKDSGYHHHGDGNYHTH